MVKEALNSLKNDKARSLFCWLTFTLTSMFVFVFFVIAMSDGVGVVMFHSVNVPTILMIASVVLCSVELVFANDFFIRNKAKELAVRLVCGATYTQLASYLLIQTICLLVLAIPLGIAGGLVAIGFLNGLIPLWLGSAVNIALTWDAVLWTVIILGYVVLWTLILNLSFAYRNSAAQLLNTRAIRVPADSIIVLNGLNAKKTKNVVSLALFAVPLVMIFFYDQLIVPLSIISLFGLNSMLKNVIYPLLEKTVRRRIEDPNALASLGFYRNDLKIIKTNIILFVVSAIMLISMFSSVAESLHMVLILVTYFAMNILLAMSILFKYANEIAGRSGNFRTLLHIGYLKEDEKKIISSEVRYFYGTVAAVVTVYLLMMLGSMLKASILPPAICAALLAGAIVPLIICSVITRIYYGKVIFASKEEHRE